MLKSHLSEKIKDDIRGIAESVEIWKYLDDKFGDSRKITDTVMNDIKKLPKCNDDKPAEIVKFISVIEKADRDLGFLKMANELDNVIVVTEIEKKLSHDI